jgi:hypothetical protein
MSNHISANELKVKGISAIEAIVSDEAPEAMITVHGKVRFVVIPIEAYNHFRELELSQALEETKLDYEAGRYVQESISDHIERLRK